MTVLTQAFIAALRGSARVECIAGVMVGEAVRRALARVAADYALDEEELQGKYVDTVVAEVAAFDIRAKNNDNNDENNDDQENQDPNATILTNLGVCTETTRRGHRCTHCAVIKGMCLKHSSMALGNAAPTASKRKTAPPIDRADAAGPSGPSGVIERAKRQRIQTYADLVSSMPRNAAFSQVAYSQEMMPCGGHSAWAADDNDADDADE